jgi:hypothetical protein
MPPGAAPGRVSRQAEGRLPRIAKWVGSAMHEAPTTKPQSSPEAAQHTRSAERETGTPGPEQPLSAATLLRLQRTAGNTAVNDLLRRRGLTQSGAKGTVGAPVQRRRGHAAGSSLAIQRHAEGEALPAGADLIAEVETKEHLDVGGGGSGDGSSPAAQDSTPADGGGSSTAAPDTTPGGDGGGTAQDTGSQAPEATRSARQETSDKSAATTAGTAFKTQLTPAAMSLATAQTVLTGAFGGVKTIVPGSIVILADQPACAAKYDEVCMASHVPRPDGSAWKAGDCAADDAAAGVQTEGFAWEGIVYVNGKTTLVTATAHEMLHLNTAAGYRTAMGETFNEGSTEYLARKAIAAAGITVPAVTAYPTQITITQALIDLVGESALISAYFGGAGALTDLVKTKATGTWAQIRTAAEALQVDTAKNLLKAKAT